MTLARVALEDISQYKGQNLSIVLSIFTDASIDSLFGTLHLSSTAIFPLPSFRMIVSLPHTMRALYGWLHLFLLTLVDGQTFSNGFAYDTNISTLETPCQKTLNESVDCSWLLPAYAAEEMDLSTQNLSTICTSSCWASLAQTRKTIESACPVSSNYIDIDGTSYPATQRIDALMDTYNKTCLVEPSVAPNLKHETFVLMDIYRGTEKFCYDVMRAWQKQTTLTSQQNCSDCLLGTLQLDQSSGFSHSGEFEKEFSFLTSSCGNKRFAPSTAMPIALNPSQKSSTVLASASTSATAGPCMEMYTIQEDDTCNGICKAENVSTYSLMSYNRLKAYCKDLPPAGTKLCMPPSCDIYTVQGKDTCRSIAAAQPGYVTITQIQAWNPNLNALCTNMKQQEGMQICVR